MQAFNQTFHLKLSEKHDTIARNVQTIEVDGKPYPINQVLGDDLHTIYDGSVEGTKNSNWARVVFHGQSLFRPLQVSRFI
jgi:hypothetical protein